MQPTEEPQVEWVYFGSSTLKNLPVFLSRRVFRRSSGSFFQSCGTHLGCQIQPQLRFLVLREFSSLNLLMFQFLCFLWSIGMMIFFIQIYDTTDVVICDTNRFLGFECLWSEFTKCCSMFVRNQVNMCCYQLNSCCRLQNWHGFILSQLLQLFNFYYNVGTINYAWWHSWFCKKMCYIQNIVNLVNFD